MARETERDDWHTHPADATVALLRAARRARGIARDTGTKVVDPDPRSPSS